METKKHLLLKILLTKDVKFRELFSLSIAIILLNCCDYNTTIFKFIIIYTFIFIVYFLYFMLLFRVFIDEKKKNNKKFLYNINDINDYKKRKYVYEKTFKILILTIIPLNIPTLLEAKRQDRHIDKNDYSLIVLNYFYHYFETLEEEFLFSVKKELIRNKLSRDLSSDLSSDDEIRDYYYNNFLQKIQSITNRLKYGEPPLEIIDNKDKLFLLPTMVQISVFENFNKILPLLKEGTFWKELLKEDFRDNRKIILLNFLTIFLNLKKEEIITTVIEKYEKINVKIHPIEIETEFKNLLLNTAGYLGPYLERLLNNL